MILKLNQLSLTLWPILNQYFHILLKEIMIDYINMNPKKNPANWAAWGKLQYPFYFAK